MNKWFWVGLAMDGIGAIVIVIGAFSVLSGPGITLIFIGTLLCIIGTFVMVGSGFSTGFRSYNQGMNAWSQSLQTMNAGFMQSAANPVGATAATGAGPKAARLQQVGVVADAKVKQARNTGQVAGTAGIVDIDLDITIPGKDSYAYTAREQVHPTAMPRLLPGTDLKVRVDPNNTLDVMVDWTASGLAAPV